MGAWHPSVRPSADALVALQFLLGLLLVNISHIEEAWQVASEFIRQISFSGYRWHTTDASGERVDWLKVTL